MFVLKSAHLIAREVIVTEMTVNVSIFYITSFRRHRVSDGVADYICI